MLGFPEVVKAYILGELPQQCSAWSWASSLITNKISLSLCHYPNASWPRLWPSWRPTRRMMRGGQGGGHLSLLSKGISQGDIRRKIFIMSDIMKCGQLSGISFPVPSAFSSPTLAPSPAKVLSYPMRPSLNDSNDLFSIKPILSSSASNVSFFWIP